MAPSRTIRWLQGNSKLMEFIAEVVGYLGVNIKSSNNVETSKTNLNESKIEGAKYKVREINKRTFFPNGVSKYREYDTLIPQKDRKRFINDSAKKGDSIKEIK